MSVVKKYEGRIVREIGMNMLDNLDRRHPSKFPYYSDVLNIGIFNNSGNYIIGYISIDDNNTNDELEVVNYNYSKQVLDYPEFLNILWNYIKENYEFKKFTIHLSTECGRSDTTKPLTDLGFKINSIHLENHPSNEFGFEYITLIYYNNE